METQTENSRSAQEMQQTNPVEQIRQPTDRLFVFIFPLFMLAWLAIGISALCAHQLDPNREDVPAFTDFKFLINAPFSSFRFIHSIVFVTSLGLSTGFILLGMFLYRRFTKFFVYLGMGLYILFIIYVCSKFIFGSSIYVYGIIIPNYRSDLSMPIVLIFFSIISHIWTFLTAIFMILSVISFFKVDRKEIRNVVKYFCRIILTSPSIILFVGFITILGCLVFSFTINAIITDVISDRNTSHKNFDIVILILGSICALNFIYSFGLMVISEYAVNYYWKKDDEPAVGRSVSRVLKNHMGTIMFSCTPILPFICAIVQAVKHTPSLRNKENYFFYFASKIFLVLKMESFFLTVSSIYGTGFVKSVKKTFDAVLRRCMFYLAVSGVIETVTAIIVTIVFIAIGLAILIIKHVFAMSDKEKAERRDLSKINSDIAMSIASSLYGFCIPLVTFMLLMYFSAKALLFNKIMILNKEEKQNEGKTEVLNPL